MTQSLIRKAAVLLASLVAVAMVIPAFALPAVQVTGPSSVFAGDTVTLNLSAYGEELTGIEAIDVQITADSPVFGPLLGDFSAALASGGVVSASFMSDAGALGASAYISAFALDDPFFFTIPLADQANPAALLEISFLIVGVPADPIQLDFSVMFNEEEPVLTSFTVNVAQVPEPATWALLAILLAGLYAIRGRPRSLFQLAGIGRRSGSSAERHADRVAGWRNPERLDDGSQCPIIREC